MISSEVRVSNSGEYDIVGVGSELFNESETDSSSSTGN